MSEADVFQLLGLVFAAAGLGMAVSSSFYSRMLENLEQMPIIIYVGGIIRLVAGYLLVRYFSYWGWDWRLVLTILGWVALIVGVLILLLPQPFIGVTGRITRNVRTLKTMGTVAFVFGLLLMYLGFFVV